MHVKQINHNPSRRRCYQAESSGYVLVVITPDYLCPQAAPNWLTMWADQDQGACIESPSLEKALAAFDQCPSWRVSDFASKAFHSAIIADAYDGAYDVQEVETDA